MLQRSLQAGEVRFIAHEAGKRQVLGVIANGGQQRGQRFGHRQATAVQADVDLNVHPHPHPEASGKRLVLLQAVVRVDQPLHLPSGVEGGMARLSIEGLGGVYRHGLTKQHVARWKGVGRSVQERLMKYHERVGSGALHHATQQIDRRKRLHHHPVRLVRTHRGRKRIDVVVHAIHIDEHHRTPRTVALEQRIQGREVRIVRRAAVGRLPQHGGTHAGRGDARSACQQGASLHAGSPKMWRRWSLSSRPPGSSCRRNARKSSKRGYEAVNSAWPREWTLPQWGRPPYF